MEEQLMLDIENFGPCFVAVSHARATYIDDYCYGPFQSGKDAKVWMDAQFESGFRGNFHIVQLRTPNRERSYDDWWLADEYKSPEFFRLEYPDYTGTEF